MTNTNKSWQEVIGLTGLTISAAVAIFGGTWLRKTISERDAIVKIQPVQVAESLAYMVVDGANRTNYYRHLGEFKVEKMDLEKEFGKMINYSIPEGGLLRQ
jgi:hypothetical protein